MMNDGAESVPEPSIEATSVAFSAAAQQSVPPAEVPVGSVPAALVEQQQAPIAASLGADVPATPVVSAVDMPAITTEAAVVDIIGAAAVREAEGAELGSDKKKRRPWTDDEEERLRQGVAQHGAGSWAKIRDQCGFKGGEGGEGGRSCVNLKDKWRNINRPTRADAKPKRAEGAPRNGSARKKKARTPKRKRDDGDGGDGGSRAAPKWLEAAHRWCAAKLVKVDKGKVHVGSLRDKFALDADYFPDAAALDADGEEASLLAEDLQNPKTEASKKFRTEALEPVVGKGCIRQNCFINGLNQLGVFGWAVEGEVATPPARAPADKCLAARPPAQLAMPPMAAAAPTSTAFPAPATSEAAATRAVTNLAELGAPRLNVGASAAVAALANEAANTAAPVLSAAAVEALAREAAREADATAAVSAVAAIVEPEAAIVEPEDIVAFAAPPTPVPVATQPDTTVLRVPEPPLAPMGDLSEAHAGSGVARMLSTYVPTPGPQ